MIKKILLCAGAVVFSAQVLAISPTINGPVDKLSYAIGASMGLSFRRQHVAINAEQVFAGVKDGLSGEKNVKMTKAEIKVVLMNFQQKQIADQQAKREALAKKNQAESDQFFKENAEKSGIVSLKDGIQYHVIKEGTGPKPKASDTVTVNYEGTLLDGTVFDSSYERKAPATFAIGAVIPGWQKILPLMPEGSVWQVYIPPQLAYGKQGTMGPIGPNQALAFKIELIKINAKK